MSQRGKRPSSDNRVRAEGLDTLMDTDCGSGGLKVPARTRFGSDPIVGCEKAPMIESKRLPRARVRLHGRFRRHGIDGGFALERRFETAFGVFKKFRPTLRANEVADVLDVMLPTAPATCIGDRRCPAIDHFRRDSGLHSAPPSGFPQQSFTQGEAHRYGLSYRMSASSNPGAGWGA
jgi:hypothetical protein